MKNVGAEALILYKDLLMLSQLCGKKKPRAWRGYIVAAAAELPLGGLGDVVTE
jgi:hypothetical protein